MFLKPCCSPVCRVGTTGCSLSCCWQDELESGQTEWNRGDRVSTANISRIVAYLCLYFSLLQESPTSFSVTFSSSVHLKENKKINHLHSLHNSCILSCLLYLISLCQECRHKLATGGKLSMHLNPLEWNIRQVCPGQSAEKNDPNMFVFFSKVSFEKYIAHTISNCIPQHWDWGLWRVISALCILQTDVSDVLRLPKA